MKSKCAIHKIQRSEIPLSDETDIAMVGRLSIRCVSIIYLRFEVA